MHLYRISQSLLEKGLNLLIGGQFQMKTREGVFRGEIKECMALSNRRIKISFNWLCVGYVFFDNSGLPKPRKWVLLKDPPGLHHVDLEWRYFYFQTDENRVKIKGQLGEICHLFRKGNHTNLVRCGDEFVAYAKIHQLEF